MQDLSTGRMTPIEQEKFAEMVNNGFTNVVCVGDPFKVRGCCFIVETISHHGISAKGISRKEYHEARKRQRFSRGRLEGEPNGQD